MAGEVAETMGERFKRLQESVCASIEQSGWAQSAAAIAAMQELSHDPAFAEYVLGLEGQNTRLKQQIRECDARIVNQRWNLHHMQVWVKDAAGWIQAYRDKLGRDDGLTAIDELQSQLTAAQSERDEARREVKLLTDDKSRLMDRIEQLERSKAAMQNRIDRLINELEGR